MSSTTDELAWRPHRVLALILLVAVALRTASAIWLPNIVHPDENQQYLEQAGRLLTGRGMIPWEYAVGVRSWLTPAALAAVMAPAVWASDSADLALGSATAAMILLAAIGVWASFRLGGRIAGPSGAVAAGIAAAVWCELVHFSTHVLADTLSAVFLIWGLAIAYRRPPDEGRRAFLIAGILFGLAFITRLQLAPALAVAMIGLCGLQPRRYLPMMAGGLAPFILQGAVDWATWGVAFHSLAMYVVVNAGGVADQFGRMPMEWYLRVEASVWRFAAPLILITALFGARRAPLLALVGVAILATFSAVGHKEARFVYPALPLLFTLCGVGMAELARLATSAGVRPRVALGGLLALFLTASAATAAGPKMTVNWLQYRQHLLTLQEINRDPAACGVGWDRQGQWDDAGFIYLRRDLSFYISDLGAPDRARAFNYLITHEEGQPAKAPDSFRRLSCGSNVYSPWLSSTICLWRRPGGCDGRAAPLLKAVAGPEAVALRKLGLKPLQ